VNERVRRFVTSVCATALLASPSFALTQTIQYSDFADLSAFTLNGSATALNAGGGVLFGGQKVLRLTDSNPNESGSAFLTNPIPLADAGGFRASFSTAFQFQITNPGGISDNDGPGADGLCFVVQTVANNVGATGGGIGYQGIPNSLGIEFDTYDNGVGVGDPNGNHLGIDLNGSVNSAATALIDKRMNDGDLWNAWVDYNGATHDLEVRLTTDTTRPSAPTLAYNTDLTAVLAQENAFIGFTSGTGSAWGQHDIRSWTFTNTYNPIGTTVPEPGSLALLIGAIPTLIAVRRRRI
jgi:hypothetical protein